MVIAGGPATAPSGPHPHRCFNGAGDGDRRRDLRYAYPAIRGQELQRSRRW